jgi:hypothetical protein
VPVGTTPIVPTELRPVNQQAANYSGDWIAFEEIGNEGPLDTQINAASQDSTTGQPATGWMRVDEQLSKLLQQYLRAVQPWQH